MGQSNEQKELWLQVRQGDKKAFEALFREYYRPLCIYCRNLLKDIDEAEDAVQTLFYNIWVKRERIEVNSSVKSYLYRAAHNDCLNRLEHGRVRRQHAGAVLAEGAPKGSDSSELIRGKQVAQRLETALSALPDQCRTVFTLNRFEHLSYAEIASKLGISIKTVEAHIGKALRILREQMKEFLSTLLIILCDRC